MDDSERDTVSPFHAGEQEVQRRVGVREKLEKSGRIVIRDHMPVKHRAFYAALPFVLVGAVDEDGQPWASILAGCPGFMTSPDPRTLDIAARPLEGDPLRETLTVGADVGLLGIQLETRRRNRVSGRVVAVRPDGLTVSVRQAFGNCPKYIQTRAVERCPDSDAPAEARPVTRSDRFDAKSREIIARSDTMLISTAFADGDDAPSRGADVSHRGGKPGFIRIADERTLVIPDFAGNNYFNTIGNLVVNPRAGLLFIDFDSGDLIYSTGRTEMIWAGAQVRAFAGAERLIRFRAETVIRTEATLPLRFRFGEYSPTLDHTGDWRQVPETNATDRRRSPPAGRSGNASASASRPSATDRG